LNAYFRIMAWIGQRRRYAMPLWIILLAVFIGIAIWMGGNERDERDATFLTQCRDAGYDEAKCRFFLTVTGRAGNNAAVQMIIQSATH